MTEPKRPESPFAKEVAITPARADDALVVADRWVAVAATPAAIGCAWREARSATATAHMIRWRFEAAIGPACRKHARLRAKARPSTPSPRSARSVVVSRRSRTHGRRAENGPGRSHPKLAVRTQTDKLEPFVVRLATGQHEVWPDMGIAVIGPVAAKRMIEVALRQRSVRRRQVHRSHQQIIQPLAELPRFLSSVRRA